MTITVDNEGKDLLIKLIDEILRLGGIKNIQLATILLNTIKVEEIKREEPFTIKE
jgi:hypothetical protein